MAPRRRRDSPSRIIHVAAAASSPLWIIHVAPTASPRRVRRMYDRDAPQAVLLTDGGASSESVKTALKGAKLSTFKEVGGTARKRSVLERTTPAVQRCKVDRRRSSSVQVEIRDCGVSSLHGISTSRSRRRRDLSRRNPRRGRGVAATCLDGISTSRPRPATCLDGISTSRPRPATCLGEISRSRPRRRRDLSRRNIHVTASASARLVPTEYPLRRRDPYADSLAPRRSTSAATASSWGR